MATWNVMWDLGTRSSCYLQVTGVPKDVEYDEVMETIEAAGRAPMVDGLLWAFCRLVPGDPGRKPRNTVTWEALQREAYEPVGFHLRVPRRLKAALKVLAARREESINATAIRALEAGIEALTEDE
ncbi:RNA-binding protein [Desulfosoma caldarium]|uniref:Uncharacterized protein n=1 Tax=Desulfosoma caldarium TaxID=610254 RepID=A0A3N1VKQ4_9BACT|nr:hypothetical protein [Desulfosoma caldarium]ROR03385.1 hypothetical protein EDC27_0121 [Desulfosoma caldarium]